MVGRRFLGPGLFSGANWQIVSGRVSLKPTQLSPLSQERLGISGWLLFIFLSLAACALVWSFGTWRWSSYTFTLLLGDFFFCFFFFEGLASKWVRERYPQFIFDLWRSNRKKGSRLIYRGGKKHLICVGDESLVTFHDFLIIVCLAHETSYVTVSRVGLAKAKNSWDATRVPTERVAL